MSLVTRQYINRIRDYRDFASAGYLALYATPFHIVYYVEKGYYLYNTNVGRILVVNRKTCKV